MGSGSGEYQVFLCVAYVLILLPFFSLQHQCTLILAFILILSLDLTLTYAIFVGRMGRDQRSMGPDTSSPCHHCAQVGLHLPRAPART